MEMRNGVFAILPLAAIAAFGCAIEPPEATESIRTSDQSIVGGAEATPGEYPWMAQISLYSSEINGFIHNCGGSLIAPDWVLTAAHCIVRNDGTYENLIPFNELRVTLGEHHLSQPNPAGQPAEQVRTPDQLIVHPDYGANITNDIGLIHLSSPVQLNSRVQLIKLATGGDGPGEQTWLSGWGVTEPASGTYPPSPVLKELDLPIIDAHNDKFGGDPGYSCSEYLTLESNLRPLDDGDICTLELPEDGYKSGCWRDSGSPLVVRRSASCTEQIGLHVTGDLLCVGPNVSTKVSTRLAWIQQYVPNVTSNPSYEAETMNHQTGGSHPDGWNIWDNGYISFNHTFTAGPRQIKVRAAGQNGNGWPNMQVRVNGAVIGNVTVSTAAWTDYTFSYNATAGNADVRIYFTNDYYQAPIDRNLFVDKVTIVNPSCAASSTSFTATLDVYDDWGAGYCARVILNNSGPTPTTSWNVTVDTGNSSVNQRWNSPNIAGTGVHTITPVGWNAAIPAGTTNNSTGFCALRAAGTTTMPTLVSATATY